MKQLNTEESLQPAYVVRMDVAAQHKKYWPEFSAEKQKLALQVKELARVSYFRSRTFLNARDKFIAVKVERPSLADALQQADSMAKLRKLVDAHGIETVVTKTSLLFRILK
jgi:hypothetical protein